VKSAWLARALQTVPARLLVAAVLLGAHLLIAWTFAEERYGIGWNAAPGEPPFFTDPSRELAPHNWDRLAISRWDSQHYIDLALRGHSQCPPGGFEGKPLLPFLYTCQLNFWPGYPFVGWLLSLGARLPVDYVLLGISLVSSFVLLFLWTSPILVSALGLFATYASLLAFNAHTNGFALITIQTEPLLMVFTVGALVALLKKNYLLGAFLAGTATGTRVSGAAVGVAYACAILTIAWQNRRSGGVPWLRYATALILSGWALLVIMGYFWIRFDDPLVYVHAHAESYRHSPSLLALVSPNTEWLKRSINEPLHPGFWVFAVVLWFALGHRAALRGFSVPAQVYCYALFGLILAISVPGTIDLGLEGNSRYTVTVLPAFFAIGALTRRRAVALGCWLLASFWFYRQVDLCHYLGGLGSTRFQVCHDEHWLHR
jgi:hypothetical protein